MTTKTLLAIIALFCLDTVINDDFDRSLVTGVTAIINEIKRAAPAAVEPTSLLSSVLEL
jgi:hypothetical protein